jgi:hypothetical protein
MYKGKSFIRLSQVLYLYIVSIFFGSASVSIWNGPRSKAFISFKPKIRIVAGASFCPGNPCVPGAYGPLGMKNADSNNKPSSMMIHFKEQIDMFKPRRHVQT